MVKVKYLEKMVRVKYWENKKQNIGKIKNW